MKITNVDYIKELKNLEDKMFAAEKFAQKLPFFKDQILESKITGDGFIKFNGKYKDIYLRWGICRSFHETSVNLTNYENKHEEINCHLSNIYVNTLTLYDRHDNFGLFDIEGKCEIFYTDHINSNFYVKDNQLEDFLDHLNDWYLKAKVAAKNLSENERIEKLESELSKLKKD